MIISEMKREGKQDGEDSYGWADQQGKNVEDLDFQEMYLMQLER